MKKHRTLTFALILSLVFISPLSAGQDNRLFSYANPLPIIGSFADHTWATNYDERPECPNPSKNYWYATGDCHPSQTDNKPRLLSSADADVDIATCVADPNISSFEPGPATAGIWYGITGVCHQIVNRILAATAVNGKPPITVEGAQGYEISRFVYRKYGTSEQQWRRMRSRCKVSDLAVNSTDADLRAMARRADLQESVNFILEEHYRLRQQIDQIGNQMNANVLISRNTATEINNAINVSLNRLARQLGPEGFQRLFNWPVGKRINLVNLQP
jgi:hypothetical protein